MNEEKMIMPVDIKGPEAFLDFRAISAKEINTRVCEKFMTDGVIDYDAIKEIFGTDLDTVSRVVFVLQSLALHLLLHIQLSCGMKYRQSPLAVLGCQTISYCMNGSPLCLRLCQLLSVL